MAKGLAGVIAVIEYVRLVSRRIQTHVVDRVAARHTRFAGFDEFEIPRGGGDVAFAEVVVNHHPSFGQMADHGHVTLFALVGEVCGALLGHDLRGIAVQRVPGDFELPEPRCDGALADAIQTGKPGARTRAAQPVAERIGAGQDVQLEQSSQRGVRFECAHILQRASAARQHQHQRLTYAAAS